MAKTHTIKIWPAFYAAVADGTKTFELRYNDRDYQAGDTVALHEFDPITGKYTGRWLSRKITYTTEYRQQPGYMVLALAPPASDGYGKNRHPVDRTANLPQEMQDALRELYRRFNDHPTDRQKCEILMTELGGDAHVCISADAKDYQQVQLAVLQLAYLQQQGWMV